MTSILSTIKTGRSTSGLRIILAAQEKMGKTTLCSQAPGVLLVPLEVGYAGVSVDKTPMIQNLNDFNLLLDEIIASAKTGKFPYKTIAFDSATALERYIHESVIQRDPLYRPGAGKKTITMDSAHGGFGKGYNLANDEFDSILHKCDLLSENAGINIVFTCHTFASKVMDPTSGEYDSWDLLLHSPKNMKTYGKRERITQWADIIGFIYEPVFVSKGEGIVRAMSQNKGRVMGLSRTPGYVAGNRFGIQGEITLPIPPQNMWNSLAHAIHSASGIDVFTR